MDYPILDRTAFLIERADMLCSLPPKNPMERLLLSTHALVEEQRILSALLTASLLDSHTLKLSCR